MPLAIHFSPKSMSTAKYDDCIRRLDAAGAGHPAGRLQHLCFGPSDNLQVMDVWESQESFERFGQVLMPILAELGIDPGQPVIQPLHNHIAG